MKQRLRRREFRTSSASLQTGLDEFKSLLHPVMKYMNEHEEIKRNLKDLWCCLNKICTEFHHENIPKEEKEEEPSLNALREQTMIQNQCNDAVKVTVATKNNSKITLLNPAAHEYIPTINTKLKVKVKNTEQNTEVKLDTITEEDMDDLDDLDDLAADLSHKITTDLDDLATEIPQVTTSPLSYPGVNAIDEKKMQLPPTSHGNKVKKSSKTKAAIIATPTKSNTSSDVNHQIYVSDEMCRIVNKMTNPKLFDDSVPLCKNYIRCTLIMEVATQKNIISIREGSLMFFNLDLRTFYGGETMYGVVGKNDDPHKGWKLCKILTNSQIRHLYKVGYHKLPQSSRGMDWYKKFIEKTPQRDIAAIIDDILSHKKFKRPKYTVNRDREHTQHRKQRIKKPDDCLQITRDDFERDLRDSWSCAFDYNRLFKGKLRQKQEEEMSVEIDTKQMELDEVTDDDQMLQSEEVEDKKLTFVPVIRTKSTKSKPVGEWMGFVQIRCKKRIKVGVSFRYCKAQKKFIIGTIHCDPIRAYRQYMLVRSENYDYDRDFFKRNITGSIEIRE